eukprot:Phypoly_transcript_15893.p1 GENE.Phypoly_transcript_15893~~Phypoly_transcript_15893.p1  ORF type:complete len:268 (-),score=35.41 Phypoly_transcript_15893:28-831(-)
MEVVNEQLLALEKEWNIHIIYACEAGSRIYGIDSSESDFDVKFLYVCKLDWYLSLESKTDNMRTLIPASTSSNALDMNGWELKKALTLAKKNNASLFEWMTSPIVYREDTEFSMQLQELIFTYYNKTGLAHHWRSLAQHNIQSYINVHDVKYKQYLYVIRPLLCIRWLVDNEDKSTFPPPQLDILVNEVTLPDTVREIICNLIAKKKEGSYLGEGRHSYELEKWFGWMIDTACPDYCKKYKTTKVDQIEKLDPLLDKLFYSTVMKYQ